MTSFGLGRRACPGEPFAKSRYFLYIATLLRKWKFTPTPGLSGSFDIRDKEHFDKAITLRPKPFFCTAKMR